MRKIFVLLPLIALTFIAARRRAVDHPTPPTFNKEVVRILQTHCQSCHRPNDIAPFPLLTYKDAFPVASLMKIMTATGKMPPWKAAQGCGEFVGERRLTQNEIETIIAWVDAGAPEGRKEDLPPQLPLTSDWPLGDPDLVLAMPKPYTPPADREEYRCYSIPAPNDKDVWVSTIDFRPGDRGSVHHIVPFLDPTGASAKQDPNGDGFTCWGVPFINGISLLGGWTPGARPIPLPDGTAVRIPKRSRILMQVHYSPHFGKVGVDRTEIGFYYAKSETNEQLIYDVVDNDEFTIPANNADYLVEQSVTISKDIRIHQLYPHMHLLGKSMRFEATLPDGTKRCLINVDKYEFKWQGAYVYKTPVDLPKGTRLHLEARYDNTEGNLLNPNSPPKPVSFGEKSTNEMALIAIGYVETSK